MPLTLNEISSSQRDHGGGLDAAMTQFGGSRSDWLDLSTGINPEIFPIAALQPEAWACLPDHNANQKLIESARSFWKVPKNAAILPAPGASALIATAPALAAPQTVQITPPTYNEHAAGFRAHGWQVADQGSAQARVLVHPNNPDGRLWTEQDVTAPLTVIDESFCDICPEQSLISLADRPGVVVLKSFGKFWGLAGLRLGFAIGHPDLISRLSTWLGPWAVSGPALEIGAQALQDQDWATATRARLARDSARLDALVLARGGHLVGGTSLFRLYEVDDAIAWHAKLGRAHILSRIFPYSKTFLRLGLPPAGGWDRVEAAL
ncbi:threonine-phosphate decarboxylase [Parasedimentitalea huanghaiensis]|uniref:Aminotransferase n=1 Tax=Parasedimentitalea huanghaiensis TaxID=2682100 RepID=A0A6L6WK04_9RHOB|nr:threonine-phosphate decarboxylase [Zongyanglinia huanghaiensis]MVO17701.1 aminotransferase class I/II-fold pyridoxal phosphate-dependent enzyme [Zongyanglinia huanghaiensis]